MGKRDKQLHTKKNGGEATLTLDKIKVKSIKQNKAYVIIKDTVYKEYSNCKPVFKVLSLSFKFTPLYLPL